MAPPFGSFAWTDERVELLKRLWDSGASCTAIAAQLGGEATRNSVIGKVTRLGLQPRRGGQWKSHKRDIAPPTLARMDRSFVPLVVEPEPVDDEGDTETVAAIENEAAPATFLGIALLDLKPHHCRYPRGSGSDILFCGQPKDEDSSYCAECRRRCTSRTTRYNISEEDRLRRRLHTIRSLNARRAGAAA